MEEFKKMKTQRFVLAAFLFTFLFPAAGLSHAGGLNIDPDSNGGKICKVTNLVDDQTVLGSIRRALNQGYNSQQSGFPNMCTQAIVFDVTGTLRLKSPIVLNNSAAAGFTLEKGGNGDITLDAS